MVSTTRVAPIEGTATRVAVNDYVRVVGQVEAGNTYTANFVSLIPVRFTVVKGIITAVFSTGFTLELVTGVDLTVIVDRVTQVTGTIAAGSFASASGVLNDDFTLVARRVTVR